MMAARAEARSARSAPLLEGSAVMDASLVQILDFMYKVHTKIRAVSEVMGVSPSDLDGFMENPKQKLDGLFSMENPKMDDDWGHYLLEVYEVFDAPKHTKTLKLQVFSF